MKLSHYILVVILALSAGYLGTTLNKNSGATADKETAYERVMRTGVLRCGYELWDGGVSQDPNTQQMGGAAVDVIEEMARTLNIKVEWAARIGWGNVIESLKSDKVDAICAGMWTSAAKGKQIAFVTPFAYQGVETFVRIDDTRFDGNLMAINDPAVQVATIDGDNSEYIAKTDFPKATQVSLGQLNGSDFDLMMYVATRKADVAFTVVGLWHQFEKDQPGHLKRLAPGYYLRTFGLSPAAVDNTETQLWLALDAAAHEVLNSGAVDRILDKYDTAYPDLFTRSQKAYQPIGGQP